MAEYKPSIFERIRNTFTNAWESIKNYFSERREERGPGLLMLRMAGGKDLVQQVVTMTDANDKLKEKQEEERAAKVQQGLVDKDKVITDCEKAVNNIHMAEDIFMDNESSRQEKLDAYTKLEENLSALYAGVQRFSEIEYLSGVDTNKVRSRFDKAIENTESFKRNVYSELRQLRFEKATGQIKPVFSNKDNAVKETLKENTVLSEKRNEFEKEFSQLKTLTEKAENKFKGSEFNKAAVAIELKTYCEFLEKLPEKYSDVINPDEIQKINDVISLAQDKINSLSLSEKTTREDIQMPTAENFKQNFEMVCKETDDTITKITDQKNIIENIKNIDPGLVKQEYSDCLAAQRHNLPVYIAMLQTYKDDFSDALNKDDKKALNDAIEKYTSVAQSEFNEEFSELNAKIETYKDDIDKLGASLAMPGSKSEKTEIDNNIKSEKDALLAQIEELNTLTITYDAILSEKDIENINNIVSDTLNYVPEVASVPPENSKIRQQVADAKETVEVEKLIDDTFKTLDPSSEIDPTAEISTERE